MAVMDVQRVVYNGFEELKLVADVRGESDAWPVLFLHGGGQTRHAWGKTAEIVAAQGWRTIVIDLRGHGDSEWAPNGDYSFTAFCAHCRGRPTGAAPSAGGGLARGYGSHAC
jgi:pimeloyl-ACP methyl ester carboxylesterase